MKKSFTLIEIIVSIVILGILLSIILINIVDMKKKAIANSMAQNTAILQSAVDMYFLKNESYPVEDNQQLTLENPLLINTELLVKEGYQKKSLDKKIIKEQYYWVDVFGKVWGSTNNEISSVNLLKKEDRYSLEALFGKEYEGFNVYQVKGYSAASFSKELNSFADNKETTRSYKLVSSNTIGLKEASYIQYDYTGEEIHLVSGVDKYGLETAPRGKFSNEGVFVPILRGEGEYEFEIAGEDIMYWIDFRTIEDTPGESTIGYSFKVKDSEGNYSTNWTEDFFSLKESKGILVKVDMKGDDKGNKPSLYDLNVVFKYADEVTPPPVFKKNPEKEDEALKICREPHIRTTLSSNLTNQSVNQNGLMVYSFKVSDLETVEETILPEVDFNSRVLYKLNSRTLYIENGTSYEEYSNQDTTGKCMFIVYDINISSVLTDTFPKNPICGNGGSQTNYGNKEMKIVYSTYLEKDVYLKDINVSAPRSGTMTLKYITYEYSHKGAPYIEVSSVVDIPDESCVNIVYHYVGTGIFVGGNPPKIEVCKGEGCKPVICKEDCILSCLDCSGEKEPNWCDENPESCGSERCIMYEGTCYPPVCTENCLVSPPLKPDPKDPKLNDPEWEVVDTVRFFGHGALNQLTYWYKEEHVDEVYDKENTRIEYRFAKSGGHSWSGEYEDFKTTGVATSVMATAYIQVKTKKLNSVPESDYPIVKSIKLYNEKGVLDLSMVKPTVAVIIEKDNNKNRDVFSTASRIKWDYLAFDPRNKKITDVEWAGDIREQYPAGKYEIKIRVKNEVEYWSDWVTYQFEVLEEKPVAMIKYSPSYILKGDKVSWSLGESYDPDGDKIIASEWKGDKQSIYTEAGTYKVSLRVKDEENHWSDWTEETFTITDAGVKSYRIEAETKDTTFVSLNKYYTASWSTIEADKYSDGKALSLKGYANDTYVIQSVRINGSGFEIKGFDPKNVTVVANNNSYKIEDKEGEFTFSLYGLPEGINDIAIYSRGATTIIDYIDVFATKNDKVTMDSLKSYSVQSGSVSTAESNLIAPKLNSSIVMKYKLFRDAMSTIEVYDSKNKKVKTLELKTKKSGGSVNQHSISWDGRGDNGEVLPNGVYVVRFTMIGVLGSVTKDEINVQIEQEQELFRIEGETTDTTFVSKSTTYSARWSVVESSDYSEGKAIALTGSANDTYVKFDFSVKGEGYDVKFINPKNVVISTYSNGKTISDTINANGEYYYSLRNLVYGSTVTIYSRGNTTILDYIDVYGGDDTPVVSYLTPYSYQGGIKSNTTSNVLSPKLDQSLLFEYKLVKNAYVTAAIYDGNGKKVKTIQSNKIQKGGSTNTHSLLWNGRNEDNEILPSGNYRFKLTLNGVKGIGSKNYETEVKVVNENSSYRIEGETTNTSFINKSTTYSAKWSVVESPEHSEGKALSMAGSASDTYVTANVSMTGTGFDVKLINPKNVIISAGGKSSGIINATGVYYYSLRDLPAGSYSISILSRGNTTILDYVDVYNSQDDTPNITNLSTFTYQNGKVGTIKSTVLVPELGVAVSSNYNLFKDAYVTLEILNSNNKIIRTLSKDSYKLGGTTNSHSVVWDGKDSNGNIVPSGSYKLKIEAIGVDRKGTNTKVVDLTVDDTDYSSRIEGETTNSSQLSIGTNYTAKVTRISDAIYSNGSAIRFSGSASDTYANGTYTFKGTGLDLKIFNEGTTNISVDGVFIGTDIKGGEQVLSFRNLSSGTHTIKVHTYGGHSTVDYLNVY